MAADFFSNGWSLINTEKLHQYTGIRLILVDEIAHKYKMLLDAGEPDIRFSILANIEKLLPTLDDIVTGKINVYYRKPYTDERNERMVDVAGAYFEKHPVIDADFDFGLWVFYDRLSRELWNYLSGLEDPIDYGWSLEGMVDFLHQKTILEANRIMDLIENWPEELENKSVYDVYLKYRKNKQPTADVFSFGYGLRT